MSPPDKHPHLLVALLVQELLESVGAEIVEELLAVLCSGSVLADMEVYGYVQSDSNVILCRAFLDLYNL